MQSTKSFIEYLQSEVCISTDSTCSLRCRISSDLCLGWRELPSSHWCKSPRWATLESSVSSRGSSPGSSPRCLSRWENRCRYDLWRRSCHLRTIQFTVASTVQDRSNWLPQSWWRPHCQQTWCRCEGREWRPPSTSGWRGRRWSCPRCRSAACRPGPASQSSVWRRQIKVQWTVEIIN